MHLKIKSPIIFISLRLRVVVSIAICFSLMKCIQSFTLHPNNEKVRQCKSNPASFRETLSSSSSSSSTIKFHLAQSSSPSEESKNEKENETFTLHLSHENKISTISIHKSETILHALERHQSQSKSNKLSSLPTLPHECRKGNCLTCAAKLISQPPPQPPLSKTKQNQNQQESNNDYPNNKNSIKTVDDGLSPYIKDLITKKGYVQTCCSYVIEDNVWLELDVCHDAWDFIYDHHDGEDGIDSDMIIGRGERIRNEARAKCIRLADERNVQRWAEKTMRMLDQ